MPPSTTNLSGRTSSHDKKPPHRRYDSGELDVFQATKYFSGAIDGMIAFVGQETKMGAESDAGLIYKRSHQIMAAKSSCCVEQTQKLPADHNININHHQNTSTSSLVMKDNKLHSRKRGSKQSGAAASSPAAWLASFFNFFFNHNTRTNTTSSSSSSTSTSTSAASKTARRLFKSATIRSLKDGQAAGGATSASGDHHRKRRSSTGDFRSSRSSGGYDYSHSIYSYRSRSRSRSKSTTSTTAAATPPPGLNYYRCYKEASRYPLTITVKSQQQQPQSSSSSSAVNLKSQASWQDKRMIIQIPAENKSRIDMPNSCSRSDEMTTSSKVAQHDGDGDGDEFTNNNNNNNININALGSSCWGGKSFVIREDGAYDGESDASSDLFELNTIHLPAADLYGPTTIINN